VDIRSSPPHRPNMKTTKSLDRILCVIFAVVLPRRGLRFVTLSQPLILEWVSQIVEGNERQQHILTLE